MYLWQTNGCVYCINVDSSYGSSINNGSSNAIIRSDTHSDGSNNVGICFL